MIAAPINPAFIAITTESSSGGGGGGGPTPDTYAYIGSAHGSLTTGTATVYVGFGYVGDYGNLAGDATVTTTVYGPSGEVLGVDVWPNFYHSANGMTNVYLYGLPENYEGPITATVQFAALPPATTSPPYTIPPWIYT